MSGEFLSFPTRGHFDVSRIDSDFVFSEPVKEVRSLVNKSLLLIKHPDRLLSPNLAPPRLYGLSKLHTFNTSIRHVVSFNSAPTYALAKFLDQWFKVTALH